MGDQPLTMSSIEIAELTGKRHDHVIRDIRKMLEDIGEASPQFWGKVPSNGGRPLEVANLPQRECLTLISGYDVRLRAKIIDRWMELEKTAAARPAAVDFSDPVILLGAFQHLQHQVEEKTAEIAYLTPKADALDRIATADGSLCITDAAKALQIRPKDLFEFLRSHGWIYRRPGSGHDLGYQSKVAAALLEHKVTTVLRADGSEKITEQVRVTAKGMAALAKLFPSAMVA
jgi:phage antirepressor YoqD-like protein